MSIVIERQKNGDVFEHHDVIVCDEDFNYRFPQRYQSTCETLEHLLDEYLNMMHLADEAIEGDTEQTLIKLIEQAEQLRSWVTELSENNCAYMRRFVQFVDEYDSFLYES